MKEKTRQLYENRKEQFDNLIQKRQEELDEAKQKLENEVKLNIEYAKRYKILQAKQIATKDALGKNLLKQFVKVIKGDSSYFSFSNFSQKVALNQQIEHSEGEWGFSKMRLENERSKSPIFAFFLLVLLTFQLKKLNLL